LAGGRGRDQPPAAASRQLDGRRAGARAADGRGAARADPLPAPDRPSGAARAPASAGRQRVVTSHTRCASCGAAAMGPAFRVAGVEPSRWAAERARSRGVEVMQEPEGPFDAVAMGDVIEHLRDPGAVLDRMAALLAPGGVIWIATPDAGSRVARLLGRHWWS